MRSRIITLALTAALGLASARVEARTVRDEPYPMDTTWNAVIRMVRVDFGFTIDERDRDLGYFTFQYREGRRSLPGSVEILRSEVDGRPCTRVVMQINGMPTYVETMLLSRLSRKLRAEFGEPPPPPRRPAQPAEEHPSEGSPPAGGSQPAAPPTGGAPSGNAPSNNAPTNGTANPNAVITLSNARWEAPRRIRAIDDFSD